MVPGGTRNAEARACLLSAVRQEVSRVGRVLEEDRVGDIPRGRVAWRGSPGGWRGRRAPREEVGWDRSLGTWWIIEGHSGVEWGGCLGGGWDGTIPWEGGRVERVPWRVEEWGLWEGSGLGRLPKGIVGGVGKVPKRIVGRIRRVPGHIVSIEKWSRKTCSHQEHMSTGASSGKQALLTLYFYPRK